MLSGQEEFWTRQSMQLAEDNGCMFFKPLNSQYPPLLEEFWDKLGDLHPILTMLLHIRIDQVWYSSEQH